MGKWSNNLWQGAKTTQWEKDSVTNGVGKTRYSYAKERSWTLKLHPTWKLIQNELKT